MGSALTEAVGQLAALGLFVVLPVYAWVRIADARARRRTGTEPIDYVALGHALDRRGGRRGR